MKVVILAGGLGTRISEMSHLKPKPMIDIGDQPILWHIMKYYSYYGFNDFIICCGYKQYVIKEYFANYFLHNSDITFDISTDNKMIIHKTESEPWRVTVVDTGIHTMTGGRIKKVKEYINDEPFLMTYGDGLCNADLHEVLKSHKEANRIATLTAIQQKSRFGVLDINENNQITNFREKSQNDNAWINGGFMVLNPEVMSFIDGDNTVFESKPLEELSKLGELNAYKHYGYWQCMDTLRDKELLEKEWNSGMAPWKKW